MTGRTISDCRYYHKAVFPSIIQTKYSGQVKVSNFCHFCSKPIDDHPKLKLFSLFLGHSFRRHLLFRVIFHLKNFQEAELIFEWKQQKRPTRT
jgi:hypothetical protein